MPATILINFDAAEGCPATPRRLHAAIGKVFDLPPGISPQRAQRIPSLAHRPPHGNGGVKPYSVGQIGMVGQELAMEVRLLDDRLIDTLDAWLAWGGVVTIGDGGPDTAHLAALEAQIIRMATWQELAQTSPQDGWQLEFITPTVFSSRGRHVERITPASVATSLQQKWWSQDPSTAPPRPQRADIEALFTWQDRTVEVPVTLANKDYDSRGRLGERMIRAFEGPMSIHAPTESPLAAEFSQLMALAEFCNVGSYSSYGLGVMSVRPLGR